LKLLLEKIRKPLAYIGIGDYFPNRVPTAQEIRGIYKWDFINLKSFYTSTKNNYQNKKTAHRMGENLC
jgi:hypothetical protein